MKAAPNHNETLHKLREAIEQAGFSAQQAALAIDQAFLKERLQQEGIRIVRHRDVANDYTICDHELIHGEKTSSKSPLNPPRWTAMNNHWRRRSR